MKPMPKLALKNAGTPIRMTGVRIDGISAGNARPGDQVSIWHRLFLTSDHPSYHRIIEGFSGFLRSTADITRANSVLLVVHADFSAELWIDNVAVAMKAVSKVSIKIGEPVFERDIADVAELWFPTVEFQPTDKIVYLFREGWRFGFLFDFNPEGDLQVDRVARELGALFRNLKYRHLYEAISDGDIFARLVKAGWFPFAEIVTSDFRPMLQACEAGFDLGDSEQTLMKAFDDQRLDRMLDRWLARPHFKKKEAILRAAINAYKRGDWISAINNVLPQIEGVLQDAHIDRTGAPASMAELRTFASASAAEKAGAPDTLLLSDAFGQYMNDYTFAHYRPGDQDEAGKRHASLHGAANPETYTQKKALQALLTIDQVAFYT